MTTWDERGLSEDMLARAIDDWVDPLDVYWIARRTGLTDEEAVRALSIGLIAHVLVLGLMEAGEVSDDGFRAWEMSPADALAWVIEQWDAWGEGQLTPGAIVWLRATPAGAEIGRAVLERESAGDS